MYTIEELIQAIENNDVDLARIIIMSRAVDINYIADSSDPLLVTCIDEAKLRIAFMLIEQGADVNLGNDGLVREKHAFKTPLTMAIRLTLQVAQDRESKLTNPQHMPLIRGSEQDLQLVDDLLERLLQAGAYVNQVTLDGTRPLTMLSIHLHDHVEVAMNIFDLLLNYGLAPKDVDDLYDSNLNITVLRPTRAIKYFAAKFVAPRIKNKPTIIINDSRVVNSSDVENIKKLNRHIDLVVSPGGFGLADGVRQLISTYNAEDDAIGHQEAIAELPQEVNNEIRFKQIVQLFCHGDYNEPLLSDLLQHYEVNYQHTRQRSSMKTFFQHGMPCADRTTITTTETILHVAIQHDCVAAVVKLIAYGADVNVLYKKETKMERIQYAEDYTEIARELIQSNWKTYDALELATQLQKEELVTLLMPHIPSWILQQVGCDNPEMTELDLSQYGLTDLDVEALCDALQTNTHVKKLILQGCWRREYDAEGQYLYINSQHNNIFFEKFDTGGRYFTARGAKCLARLSSIKELDVSHNLIGDEGAIALSQSHHIIKLSVNSCEITITGMMAFVDNKKLVDLICHHNNFNPNEDNWSHRIELTLEFNRILNSEADEQAAILQQLAQPRLQRLICDAADSRDLEKIKRLLPYIANTEGRVVLETSAWEHDSPLDIAAINGDINIVKFLLQHGEHVNRRSIWYTPLDRAIEYGHFEVAEVLLDHGANILGEDSNDPGPLGFLMEQYRKYLDRSTLSSQLKQVLESNRIEQVLDMLDDGKIKWDQVRDENFQLFSLLRLITLVWNKIVVSGQKLDHQTLQSGYDTPSPASDDSSDDEQEKSSNVYHHKAIRNHQSRHFNNLTREQLQEYLNKLNKEIKYRGIDNVNWANYPRFYVAFYRGVHFYRHKFTPSQRREYRKVSHIHRINPSSGAYDIADSHIQSFQLTSESALEQSVLNLREWHNKLSEIEEDVDAYWQPKASRARFKSAREQHQMRYTNSMPRYLEDKEEARHDWSKSLRETGVKGGVPFFSTAAEPKHALRYAFGQKPDKTSEDWRLRPRYLKKGLGKAKRPYPGEIFIYLMTPAALGYHNPNNVIAMYADGLRIHTRFKFEGEHSFPGGIEQVTCFYEAVVKIPSLIQYKSHYLEKYGLTKAQFNRFKKRMRQAYQTDTPEKKEIENKRKAFKKAFIEQHLVPFWTNKLSTIVTDAVSERGGYLVYRGLNNEFTLDAPEFNEAINRHQQAIAYPSPAASEQAMDLAYADYEGDDEEEQEYGDDEDVNMQETSAEASSSSSSNSSSAANKLFNFLDERFQLYEKYAKLHSPSSSQQLEEVAKQHGFICQDVARDGNCFFHAVQDQLSIHLPGYGYNHQELRRLSIHYMLNHFDDYRDFITEDKNKFIAKLTEDGEWANNYIIDALAKALDLKIIIYRSDGQEPIEIEPEGCPSAVITLGYEVGMHYQSLIIAQSMDLMR